MTYLLRITFQLLLYKKIPILLFKPLKTLSKKEFLLHQSSDHGAKFAYLFFYLLINAQSLFNKNGLKYATVLHIGNTSFDK